RGARKGWVEVWQAFYRAFGSPAETPHVRLIIKARPDGNDMLDLIAGAERPDPRIRIMFDDLADIADFYRLGDCMVIPSRSEGWGMPHREAAMMGLPVITQRYSGMDDGYTDAWAIVIEQGTLEGIPARFEHIAGEWRRADIDELAQAMRRCYSEPEDAAEFGEHAAAWLQQNQTWDHSADALVGLLQAHA
ncbi:MAG: glycosyltransferase family 4 protein, partial [Caldilineaceae bacterium]|nr:glycosyltransferase family 4 protein [Caldilineaceae bacterium]